MTPRVCILCRENVLHWVPFYVDAFRQCCEVVTVGPGLDRGFLEEAGLGHAAMYRQPNDFVTETDDAREALALLPKGWQPDLVVGIQSAAPAYRNIHDMACPTAYISVDTWHDPREFQVARNYDYVFAAQRALVPYLHDGGCRHARWLPLACSPAHHHPEAVEEAFDIVFVGTLRMKVNEQRIQRLGRLGKHFRVAKQTGAGPEDMRRAFCRGRLAFNSSIAQDVNMRVFEVMAMGRPLLTNRDAEVNGLFELFEEGRHLITYDDGDLIEQARRYLADGEARRRIGAAARAEVLAKHTYRHRVETLLKTVLTDRGRFEAGPLLREGDRPSAYLPHGVRTMIDVGANMGQSRIALHRMGIETIIAVAPDEAWAKRRARSYDVMHRWPIAPHLLRPVDAVVWSMGEAVDDAMENVLAWAFGALKTGGTLLLRYGPGKLNATALRAVRDAWDAWLFDRGFHLMIFRPPCAGERWHYITARKFTRHVREMSSEIYRRFPGGYLGGP